MWSITTQPDCYSIHLITITLFNREVTPPHCAAPGERGHRCEASGGVSEEGQQVGGAGAEAGAETRRQGPDRLPQQVGGPGQDQPPQEEPTGNKKRGSVGSVERERSRERSDSNKRRKSEEKEREREEKGRIREGEKK